MMDLGLLTMTFERLKNSVALYYRDKLLQHGPTARGVDWNSEDSQRLRFEQLLKVLSNSEPFTVNDYGCGYGALADFLCEKGFSCQYAGVDVSPEMIEAARKMHQDKPWVGFSCEKCPVSDYTLASGIFNVRLDVPIEEWLRYVLFTIDQMSTLSIKAFAFNALTNYSDPRRMRSHLFYANPCFLFDYCKKNLSRHVALLHDYGLYEFTIIVRKD